MIDQPIYFQSKGAEEYRFLSNFWFSPLRVPTRWGQDFTRAFATVEHAYQAQKADAYEDYLVIATASSPREAKDLGAKVKMTSMWEQALPGGLLFKDQVMLSALVAKFEQHADLRAQLLGTRNRHLVEYAPWGDRYWGVDKAYQGRNMLGTLLMLVRATLGREMV